MTLFGEVAPVSSDEVLAIGSQQLGVTASGELSWDMVKDALIRERKFAASWLHFYNASHSLALCTSWIWSYRKWSLCSPLVSQEGGGLHHLTVSPSAMLGASVVWNILSMRPSYFGQGQASCMLQLPGIINHSCFWRLPCSQIGPPSLLKGRLFLGQCCARHNNCGSHVTMLN